MRNLPTMLAAALVVLVLVFYMCTFQVRFTEVAIKKTFGNAPENGVITEPGLYAKWPWPIQSVVKYDKRIRHLDDRTEETITADSKNVIIATTALWTIEDPYLFHERFSDGVADGAEALRSAIRSQKKAVVGRYDFSNFVSTDADERKLRQIEKEIMDPVRAQWLASHGVDIKYFGITKLTLPQSVTEAIFESMKKNEQNKADNYKAEGEAKAQQIVANAAAASERIMSVAQRKSDQIRSEGDRIVSEIYSSFSEHPELRIYLDKLETMQSAYSQDTIVIMDTTQSPVDLFLGKPIESSHPSGDAAGAKRGDESSSALKVVRGQGSGS